MTEGDEVQVSAAGIGEGSPHQRRVTADYLILMATGGAIAAAAVGPSASMSFSSLPPTPFTPLGSKEGYTGASQWFSARPRAVPD
jgi:hypothetical protein